MKKPVLQVFAFLLTAITSLSVFATVERVIISGSPTVLEKRGEVYYFPTTVTTTPAPQYYYVTLDNANKVCYLTEQPTFANLHAMTIQASLGNTVQNYYCYDSDPIYFEMK